MVELSVDGDMLKTSKSGLNWFKMFIYGLF
jgi:hypothetical protein